MCLGTRNVLIKDIISSGAILGLVLLSCILSVLKTGAASKMVSPQTSHVLLRLAQDQGMYEKAMLEPHGCRSGHCTWSYSLPQTDICDSLENRLPSARTSHVEKWVCIKVGTGGNTSCSLPPPCPLPENQRAWIVTVKSPLTSGKSKKMQEVHYKGAFSRCCELKIQPTYRSARCTKCLSL